jgi:hypothetical protein
VALWVLLLSSSRVGSEVRTGEQGLRAGPTRYGLCEEAIHDEIDW